MLRLDFRVCATILSCLTLLIGCGTEEMRPSAGFSGTVSLDGKPLPAGSIHFTSPKTGETAYTNLESGGRYSVEFPEADIGTEYEVAIGPPIEENVDATELAENPREKTKSPIPRKYSDRTTSGLKAKIDHEGENELNFDLTSR